MLCGDNLLLKDPSQPPPFSIPSKLLILLGEVESYCFSSFTVISFVYAPNKTL